MKIEELRSECAKILLDGNIRFDDEGNLLVDISEKDKELFVEYVINLILRDALNFLENK